MPDDREETIELRAEPKPYFVFGVMFGLPAIVFVIDYVRGEKGARQGALLFLGIGLFAMGWLRFYRLKLSRDLLEFRSLFGGRHSVPLEDIEDSFEARGKRGSYRVVVVPSAASGKPEFWINARVFDHVQMKRVYERLGTREIDWDAIE